MTNKYLFDDKDNLPSMNSVVRGFLGSLYLSGNFVKFLDFFSKRVGYVSNEVGFFLPDFSDPDPIFHFTGILVWYSVSRATLAEIDFVEQVIVASKIYCAKHPNEENHVSYLLEKIRNNCK